MPEPSARLIVGKDHSKQSLNALAFPTILGKVYRLQRKDALTDGVWSVVIDNIPGTVASVSVTDIGGGVLPRRFYRVAVW